MSAENIQKGNTFLGIELGSTRIKAVLLDDSLALLASGGYEWENRLEGGYWTYPEEEIRRGVQGCYADLAANVYSEYGVKLTTAGAIGISAMMHGYLAFDAQDRLLVPFRTWRCTTAERAAKELTDELSFNIPLRWSVSHLYQAILDGEPHVPQIAHITTLAGYIHFLLSGRRELGIGDASGMFPISGRDYDGKMLQKFDALAAKRGFDRPLREILPTVRCAGDTGAYLTEAGAAFLDPTGTLAAGIPLCPPEGDAGTGMTATNSVLPRTGNISAGTSIFAMLVLEKPLGGIYPEVDMVTAPDGAPVAMVHCNNCCGEVDEWVKMFGEFAHLAGADIDKSRLYETLYAAAMRGDADCGGIAAYNYLSGEPVSGIENGAPLYFREPGSRMSLNNFMRAQLYATIAALKLGMDILFEKEGALAEQFWAHGGLFKVRGAAQQIMADALDTPVSVMENAGEGGAWGMALLAAYMRQGKGRPLGEWLNEVVFPQARTLTAEPEEKGRAGFRSYMERYKAGLPAARELDRAVSGTK